MQNLQVHKLPLQNLLDGEGEWLLVFVLLDSESS